MTEVNIQNNFEVGASKFAYTGKKFFVYDSVFKAEQVRIKKVEIVQDNSEDNNNDTIRMGGGIIGAILGGIIGAAVMSMKEPITWDIEADVILWDGRILEVRLHDQKMIEALYPYTQQNARVPHRYRNSFQEEESTVEEDLNTPSAVAAAQNGSLTPEQYEQFMKTYGRDCTRWP